MRNFIFCALLLACAGCRTAPSYLQTYPGPLLASEAHARIVTLPADNGSSRPVISCVDGKPTHNSWLRGDYPPEVFVLPGRHYIGVLYHLPLFWTEGALWLDAQPGRTYNVTWQSDGRRIGFFLVDAETRRVVGGVVGSEPSRGPEEQVCVPRRSL